MTGYRKGIILAGGSGSRLYPMTRAVNKQLLPVYDKPMIYYPLSTLMSAVVSDILIISSPDQIENFRQMFGSGSQLGLNLSYAVQQAPRGLPEAFLIAHDVGFLEEDDPVALALGDNIFYGADFYKDLMYVTKMNTSCVFGYRVSNPEEYGVVDFVPSSDPYDNNVQVKCIEEKPDSPKSNFAVPGLYFYDNTVVKRSTRLKPSWRDELEITDLNNSYIKDKKLNVKLLKENAAWFDTGTPEAMFEASMFVKSIQSRTGNMIGCIEEVAYKKKFIDESEFKKLIKSLPDCQYQWYLKYKYLETSLIRI